MPRRLPPLNALRAFEAAGRHESFSRAADELGVSHSAVSKHVRGLEDRLGVRLFRDLPRGVALSAEGARYLAALTPAFDAIAEATEIFATRPAGAVTVNAESTFGLKWLIHHLPSFRDLHPDIVVDLQASAHLADLGRYEADIAIRFVSSGRGEEGAILLSNAPLYPYASPALAQRIGSDVARLLEYPLLRDRAVDPWAQWFELAGAAHLNEGRSAAQRMRAELAHEAALAGYGVLLASEENVALDVAAGRLVRCFDLPMRQGAYFIMFGEGVLRRQPVRVFRDWLLEETAQFRGEGPAQIAK